MNNPLAQKYQYYINESNRLSEELQNEVEYSELLENVLFELLGEEDFTKLFEYVMKGSLTHDEKGNPLSPARGAQRAKRIQQIIDIGSRAHPGRALQARAAASLVAKNVQATGSPDLSDHIRSHSNYGKLKDSLGARDTDSRAGTSYEVKPTPANKGRGDHTPEEADKLQKRMSKEGRTQYKALRNLGLIRKKKGLPGTTTQTGPNTFQRNNVEGGSPLGDRHLW